jgi:cytochrome P450 / NADPH-cytochrome P450 reductase
MTVKPRTNLPPPSSEGSSVNHDLSQTRVKPTRKKSILTSAYLPLPKLTILYGSNTGGSEDYANQSGAQAKSLGFQDISVKTLDEWEVISQGKYDFSQKNDQIEELVIVITSTYNGTPPDNAQKFNQWINSLNEDDQPLKGLHYTVFGCGNSQWKSTYQSFPKKVDATFDKLGAERFYELGEGVSYQISLSFSLYFIKF